MIKLAKPYQEAIQAKLQEIWVAKDPRYKFAFFSTYWNPSAFQDGDGWSEVTRAVLDTQGNLVGYFGFDIERDSGVIYGVKAISFVPGDPRTLMGLLRTIRDTLQHPGISKVKWQVAVGNPAEKTYDKILTRYPGGRIMGIALKEDRLWDGRLYDRKYYEWSKPDRT